MDEKILGIVDAYLASITDDDGNGWTSHPDANYVYWANERERSGALSYLVNATDLDYKGLMTLCGECIELCGPAETVTLPLSFNIGKIKQGIKDALGTAPDANILKIADILGVELT